MRTDAFALLALPALLALFALGAPAARADDGSVFAAERFSVGLPLEAHVVGAAAGLRPEVSWRPLAPDGVFHIVAAVGVLPGHEYVFVPVNLGARWRWRPWRFFQPALGVGVEEQTFWVTDGGPFARTAFYGELGASVAVAARWSVGAAIVPSLAPFGVPGPGLAGRLTLTLDLGDGDDQRSSTR